ncbi:unnamed protein product [Chondrus crispus]|uniref:Uncharacterized protein n=1 Tax=Chondrus crispus TaxID=2769 RepID=R7Q560_CHOCR|nr:unnamed protein product [Chondrus crispus]CDF33164.1 unnamed protein product [Chondrus crispus]|eukprot:XP_005712967.1 unnamed protein product [Chondrus crispus]
MVLSYSRDAQELQTRHWGSYCIASTTRVHKGCQECIVLYMSVKTYTSGPCQNSFCVASYMTLTFGKHVQETCIVLVE